METLVVKTDWVFSWNFGLWKNNLPQIVKK